MTDTNSLAGKVAVITGGSRGIGFAIAQAFTSRGCEVVITGRNATTLNSAIANLKESNAKVLGLPCNVVDPAQVERLFAQVKQAHSKIDILVNNAGISHALAPVEQLPIESWRSAIDVNLSGMFFCTQQALPLMSSGGTIVNNLSIAAVHSFPGMAAYNASKAGALGFTNVLREELRKRGIRVVALIVGATATEIWDQFWPEAPKDKMVLPTTVADAVLQAVTLPETAAIEEIRLGPTAGAL
ncbi:MAG TPA: SDR family NAD(P)-dependent oxidoreductase [Candidatus Angelobacter sp.]